MRLNPPDAYWKKDVVLFFSKRFALAIKLLYPMALIVPVAASDIPAQYAAAVIGIVAVMAGTFGAGANFTSSPADVLLYATAILAPLIYLSGFFRNQNPTGLLAALRDLIPFAYAN